MIKIGITGGIGSGKSIVSALLATFDIPVYNADIEAKKLYQTDKQLKAELIDLLGDDIYIGETLNRQRMASLIFNNAELLKGVNKLVHPAVFRDFDYWCNRQNKSIVAIESAILFDCGMDKQVDYTINVTAPLETRIERVMARDGASREEVIARSNNQMNDALRSNKASFVVYNDNKTPLIPQIENIVHQLQSI